MKILIIEDSDYKYNDVERYLKNLGEENITRRKSINGGLLELRNNFATEKENWYDLLILDMQLPRYEEGPSEISPVGGNCVLREIDRKDWPIKVAMCSSEQLNLAGFYEMPQLIGQIKYASNIYLESQFEAILKKVSDLMPEETYVNIYYSFDANAIKKFDTRRQALDFIDLDVDDEVRIQTKENGKVEGVDFVLEKDVEGEEYAKITFKNGDIIEWSIPEIL